MTFNFLGPGLTVNVEAKVKEQIILDSSVFTWYFLTIAQPVKMTIAAASQSEIACIWDPWEVNEIFSNNYRCKNTGYLTVQFQECRLLSSLLF